MPASRVGYVYDTAAADYIPFTGPPAALPSGMLTMTAANAAPTGWMLCNGSAISRTTYADLFTAIGTTYGVGNGTTTFNLPDLRGRVPVGTDSSQTEFDALGETGGVKSVTLTSAQSGVPAHSHPNSLTGSTTFASDGHYHLVNNDFTAAWHGGNGLYYGEGVSIANYGSNGTSGNYGSASVGLSNANNSAANAASAHTNLQPYIAMNYIIKT